jgi:hypothetical protein
VTIGRRAGAKSSLAAFRNQLMSESHFATKATEFVHRYCDECSIPFQLVEPLFFTCWMHRAIKESTRLSKERMEGGHYVNLLRLCIDRRNDLKLYRTPNRSMYSNENLAIHNVGHELGTSHIIGRVNQSMDKTSQTLLQDMN